MLLCFPPLQVRDADRTPDPSPASVVLVREDFRPCFLSASQSVRSPSLRPQPAVPIYCAPSHPQPFSFPSFAFSFSSLNATQSRPPLSPPLFVRPGASTAIIPHDISLPEPCPPRRPFLFHLCALGWTIRRLLICSPSFRCRLHPVLCYCFFRNAPFFLSCLFFLPPFFHERPAEGIADRSNPTIRIHPPMVLARGST